MFNVYSYNRAFVHLSVILIEITFSDLKKMGTNIILSVIMRLSKAQKAALLFGAFSVIADQISDVWMAFNYHFNCHYVWSRTAFILTFWHLPMAGLIANLTCYPDIKTRFIATIKGIFSPFWIIY